MILDQHYTENAIRTFTGKAFDVKILDPDSICIEDIAHALSFIPRFAGHLPKFYSVAQHSFFVSKLLHQTGFELEGLLHDATEAYLCDIPAPFKKLLPDYKALEERVANSIALKFKLQYPYPKDVKISDDIMLSREWNSFVPGIRAKNFVPMEYWSPQRAKDNFMSIYRLYKRT